MIFEKIMDSKIIGTGGEEQSACQARVTRFLDNYGFPSPGRSQRDRYKRVQMILSKQGADFFS